MNEFPDAWRVAFAVVVGLVAFAAGLWAVNRFVAPAQPVAGYSLDQTIGDIKSELQRLANAPGPALGLDLSDIKIVLQVQKSDAQTTQAALSVPVFKSADAKASLGSSQEMSSKVTIVLVPPSSRSPLSATLKPTIKFADLLIAARNSLVAADAMPPRLDTKSISVELAFVLVASKSASVGVTAELVSIGVAGESKATTANTVTLTYVNPAYKDKAAISPP